MKTISLSHGDSMPMVGLGTWKTAPGQTYQAVREALRLGYRHFDCAPLYGNEAEIGQALRDALREGQVTRPELWITSKLWGNAHGRANVDPALRRTLQDLGLDYLDLYLIHWPIPLQPTVTFPASGADFAQPAEVPLRSTWEGLEDAVRAGLTRHIGVSNFSAQKIRDLLPHCQIRPEVNQVELHPWLQQPALVRFCASHGIHITAYSPLGSPDRPAFLKAPDAPVPLAHPVIQAIAQARGFTPAQVLLTWQIQRGISVIPKSVHPSRLRENLAAADLALTPSDRQQIDGLNQNLRLIDGAFWAMPGSPWTLQTLWDEA